MMDGREPPAAEKSMDETTSKHLDDVIKDVASPPKRPNEMIPAPFFAGVRPSGRKTAEFDLYQTAAAGPMGSRDWMKI